MSKAKKLLKFIKKGSSPFHVVQESIKLLQKRGFQILDVLKPWELEKGKSYYVNLFDSTIFAFTIGEDTQQDQSFHLAAAHTDFPCFHIKPSAELTERGYLKLNTEGYGGAILNTWLDRPLSIAGKIALKSQDIYQPAIKLIDIERPVLTIPNLAIHMNREINKGIELNKQTHLLPLFGINKTQDREAYFLDFLAEELQVDASYILNYDLCIYNTEQGELVGREEEFISSPRLDNLTSVLALLKGITKVKRQDGINCIALYDNEEIGSRSKQGADSSLTYIVLQKIYNALGFSCAQLQEALLHSILFSVDVAHAYHPNYSNKNDLTNFVELGKGIVIKMDSTQRYASDTEAIAIVQQLCEKRQIPYQKFVNRSDSTGGSTLGSILSSWLPMKTVDLGIPLLAMHSARELMGTKDQSYLEKLINAFFEHL